MIDQLTYFAEEAYNTLISEKSRKEYNSIISTYYNKNGLDEGKAEIEFTKGELFLGKRDFENAFESFKKAIEFGGQRPEYIAAYGLSLYLNSAEAQRSRETLGKLYIKRAMSQNPKCIDAHLYYILINSIENNISEVEKELEFLRTTFPNNERVKSIISLMEKHNSKKPKSGEIKQALKGENRDYRADSLLDIFFEK
jgi:tetratricopeptide (TPR) repeat protein